MNPYRPESPPFHLGSTLVDWLARELTAVERSLSTVHDLDELIQLPEKPQRGQIRYFNSAVGLLWGEGTYSYEWRGVLSRAEWWPVAAGRDYLKREVLAGGPIPVGAAWTPIMSAALTVRPLRRAVVDVSAVASTVAPVAASAIQYRLLFDGVENAPVYNPGWARTFAAATAVSDTTSFQDRGAIYLPSTQVSVVQNITLEAMSASGAGVVQVDQALIVAKEEIFSDSP